MINYFILTLKEISEYMILLTIEKYISLIFIKKDLKKSIKKYI